MNESLDTGIYYGEHPESLALQTLAYRVMGAKGMSEDGPLDVIPWSLNKTELFSRKMWRNWPQRRDSTGGGE